MRRRASSSHPTKQLHGSSHKDEDGSEDAARWDKEHWKEGYLAWCMIKLALQTSTAEKSFQALVLTVQNNDLTKPLSDRVLQDLPDFALHELCPQSEAMDILMSQIDILPIESHMPSKQQRLDVGLNWFKIINYCYRLIQRCYWQKAPLDLSTSEWNLHYHSMTPFLHTKAKAMVSFLSAHCSSFKACLIPPLPRSAFQQGIGVLPKKISSCEPHLTAHESEVVIYWHKDNHPVVPSCDSVPISEPILESDRITGYFAMNHRSVQYPNNSDSHYLGLETHIVHISNKKLSELHESWKELTRRVNAYLEAKANTRPVSRSPSKQKKKDAMMQPPEELVKAVAEGVKKAAKIFGKRKTKEVCTCSTTWIMYHMHVMYI